jgi:hypothetical protein
MYTVFHNIKLLINGKDLKGVSRGCFEDCVSVFAQTLWECSLIPVFLKRYRCISLFSLTSYGSEYFTNHKSSDVCELCSLNVFVSYILFSYGVCRHLLIMLLTGTIKLRFPKTQGLASDRNVIKTLINTSRWYDCCWMYYFEFDSQCCILW